MPLDNGDHGLNVASLELTNSSVIRLLFYCSLFCLQKLQKDGAIDGPQYFRLYPQDTILCLYGLPKIHNEGALLRPIASSINSVTYNIGKRAANILSPLVGKTSHHIQNSIDFVSNVRLKLETGETMVSFDVSSFHLYYNYRRSENSQTSFAT